MGITLTDRFILASNSPRRIELLTLLGLNMEVMSSGIDEDFISGEIPRDHVMRLSREKANLVSDLHPEAWVMGADTIVVIAGEVLGKPHTPAEARLMLGKLSGQEHKVFTGFTILNKVKNLLVSDVVESSVIFRAIREDEMSWYINTPEPYDKAGGYAVQGMGAFFIKEIHGSYTNVMGLPLSEVIDALRKIGIIKFN